MANSAVFIYDMQIEEKTKLSTLYQILTMKIYSLMFRYVYRENDLESPLMRQRIANWLLSRIKRKKEER